MATRSRASPVRSEPSPSASSTDTATTAPTATASAIGLDTTLRQLLTDAKQPGAAKSADYIDARGIRTLRDWRNARPQTIQQINFSRQVPLASLAAIKRAIESIQASEAKERAESRTTARAPAATATRRVGLSETQRAALGRPFLEGPVTVTEYAGLGRHFLVLGDWHQHLTTCRFPLTPPENRLRERSEAAAAATSGPPRSATTTPETKREGGAEARDEKRGGGTSSRPSSGADSGGGGGGGGGGAKRRHEASESERKERKGGGGGGGEPESDADQRSIEVSRWIHSIITEQAALGHAIDVYLENQYARKIEPGQRREDVRTDELASTARRRGPSGSYLEDAIRYFGACLDPDDRTRCAYTGAARFHNADVRTHAFEARPATSSERYDGLISVAFGLARLQNDVLLEDETAPGDRGDGVSPELARLRVTEKLRADLRTFLQSFDFAGGGGGGGGGSGSSGAVEFLAAQLRPSAWIVRKLRKELAAVSDARVRDVIRETLPIDEAAIDYTALAETLLRVSVALQQKAPLAPYYFALRPLIRLHDNVLHRSDQYLAARMLRDWPAASFSVPPSSSSPSSSSSGALVADSRPIERGIVLMGDAHARNIGRVMAGLAFLGMRRIHRATSDVQGRDFQCVPTKSFTRPYLSEPRKTRSAAFS